MKSIAVMQPYFAPYIGYVELIAAVDQFVLLDTVQFPRRGWVNRNRFRADRSGGRWSYVTLPTRKMARSAVIHECSFEFPDGWAQKFMQRVALNYGNAARTSPFAVQIADWADAGSVPIVSALLPHLEKLGVALGLNTEFLRASSLELDTRLTGQARIVAICNALRARRYVNLPGGRDLYDPGEFVENGVELQFLAPTTFPKWSESGVHLSVLDGVFGGKLNEMRKHLKRFQL